MGLQTRDLHVEIAVANMDFYPYDRPGMPHWGSTFEQLVPFLARTGIRNFEVHPTRTLVEDAHGRIKSGDTEIIEQTMGSMHQTFNDGTGLFGIAANLRGIYGYHSSIPAMRTLQTAIGRPIPAVHLPRTPLSKASCIPHQSTQDQNGYPGSYPIMQPAAEAYRDFHASTPEELAAEMLTAGIIGKCMDRVHSDRKAADGSKAPSSFSDWVDEFRGGRVFQVHAATDRRDMKKRDPKIARISVQEAKAFTSSSWQRARNTRMGDMIVAGIENWVQPEELTEAPTVPVLRMVMEKPPLPLPDRFIWCERDHAQMAENLGQIAREAGATVLRWGDNTPLKSDPQVA